MKKEWPPRWRRRRRQLFVAAVAAALVITAIVLVNARFNTSHSNRTSSDGTRPPSSGIGTVAESAVPLDPARRDCAPSPHACGYPDATNTGVPAGTKLAKSGCIDATHNNQVVQNVTITNCTIDVKADNVIIRNVKIVIDSPTTWAIIVRPGASASIDHVDVSGVDDTYHNVQYTVLSQTTSRVTVQHSNLYNCSNCIQGDNVTATDNYIHNINGAPGAHRDGILCVSNHGCGLTATHNTVFAEHTGAAIALYSDFGTPHNSVISDNLLGGGGYTVYGGGADATNIRITDNRFTRIIHPNSGIWGPLAYFNPNGSGNTFSGNIWDDTGKPVSG